MYFSEEPLQMIQLVSESLDQLKLISSSRPIIPTFLLKYAKNRKMSEYDAVNTFHEAIRDDSVKDWETVMWQ